MEKNDKYAKTINDPCLNQGEEGIDQRIDLINWI